MSLITKKINVEKPRNNAQEEISFPPQKTLILIAESFILYLFLVVGIKIREKNIQGIKEKKKQSSSKLRFKNVIRNSHTKLQSQVNMQFLLFLF